MGYARCRSKSGMLHCGCVSHDGIRGKREHGRSGNTISIGKRERANHGSCDAITIADASTIARSAATTQARLERRQSRK